MNKIIVAGPTSHVSKTSGNQTSGQEVAGPRQTEDGGQKADTCQGQGRCCQGNGGVESE